MFCALSWPDASAGLAPDRVTRRDSSELSIRMRQSWRLLQSGWALCGHAQLPGRHRPGAAVSRVSLLVHRERSQTNPRTALRHSGPDRRLREVRADGLRPAVVLRDDLRQARGQQLPVPDDRLAVDDAQVDLQVRCTQLGGQACSRNSCSCVRLEIGQG